MVELKRGFGFWTILALLLTAMMGTGMFFGTALGSARAGNAVLIGWVIIICMGIYVAACFGELVAMFPRAGGVYEFAKQAYGSFISFMVGWTAWLMSTVSIIVLVIAAVEYLFPVGTAQTLILGIDYKIVIAIGIIIALNVIAYLGVDASAAVLMLFALVTLGVLLSIIFPGFLKINFSNLSNIFSTPAILIFAAMFFMLEALMGWEEASYLAEETKNPEKTIPKALVISTLIAGLLTIAVAFVSLGVIHWTQLSGLATPIHNVAFMLFGPSGSKIISWGIVVTLVGSAAGIVIASPRLILGMARDKLFIGQLAAIHKKRRTPYKAIIFQTVVAILLIIATAGKYQELLSWFTPIAVLVYVFVLMSVVVLRHKMPDAKRPFKVWFGRAGPLLVSLIYLAVIGVWLYLEPGSTIIIKRILSLIFFGVPIYLVLIFFYNPDAIIRFSNYFAYLAYWLENILLPKRIRKQIISVFQGLESRSILEYGSGVGTLTMHLADAVGPKGRIYATDMSKKNIKMLTKRLLKKKISHVTVIHDEHQVNRVHPDVDSVDMIFSVGMMGYMQDVKKILKEMHRLLPDGGRICFVEYINMFRFLPDAEWISNIKELKKVFRQAGFAVKIEKKHSLLWNYLFVYGIKSEQEVPII